jgi:hypothetical protein
MNFQDLLAKMKQIDEGDMAQGQGMMAPPSSPEMPEEQAQLECGDAPAQPMDQADGTFLTGEGHDEMGPEQHGQANNVSMNVTINGSGTGGISDLMKILRNIESGHGSHGDNDVLVGMEEVIDDGGFGDATTEPDAETAGIDMMTRTGNDLASKGAERHKMNGGGNPMQEALVRKLAAQYESIKSR